MIMNYKDRKIKEWAKAVKQRDNNICQNCGKQVKGGDSNAHHIKDKKEYSELRYNVNNGITLCDRCHQIIHHKGVPLSEETKMKIKISLTGKQHSEERRRKESESHKGQTPWNKGKSPSEETKLKISISLSGRKLSEDHKKKVSENNAKYWQGKSRSEETINKMKKPRKIKEEI
jgi:hypothetical protein